MTAISSSRLALDTATPNTTTGQPGAEKAKVEPKAPRLPTELLLGLAEDQAQASYWQLAHTSHTLRDLLLTPAAMRRNLQASGHPDHALPATSSPDSAAELIDMLARHHNVSRLLASSGGDVMQLTAPKLALGRAPGRISHYYLAQKNLFYVENERNSARGPMDATILAGTYLHAAQLPKRGPLV